VAAAESAAEAATAGNGNDSESGAEARVASGESSRVSRGQASGPSTGSGSDNQRNQRSQRIQRGGHCQRAGPTGGRRCSNWMGTVAALAALCCSCSSRLAHADSLYFYVSLPLYAVATRRPLCTRSPPSLPAPAEPAQPATVADRRAADRDERRLVQSFGVGCTAAGSGGLAADSGSGSGREAAKDLATPPN